MIKITAVAPFEELGNLFREVFETHEQYVRKMEDDEYELEVIIASIADEICKEKLDSDVIVARGSTATLLRNRNYHIPVVEIPIAGHDQIRDLYAYKKRNGSRKIAAVGSLNMIMGIETLADIIDLDIKAYIFSEINEIKETVDKAIQDGNEVIMGGAYTCRYAKTLEFDTIPIRTGREAIIYAISEAKRVAWHSRKEQEKALRFKTILDYAFEGVIAVDNRNIVTVFNSCAEKMLDISSQKAIGNNLDDVIPKSNLKDLTQLSHIKNVL